MRDSHPFPPLPRARSGFGGGPLTFTYTITDGVSKDAADAATVTLNFPLAALIVPSNFTFQTPYETPTNSAQTSNLLADIQSDDPTRPMKLVVKGLLKQPQASEGTVEVKPDGTYTFTPAKGFSGEGRGRVLRRAGLAYTHGRDACVSPQAVAAPGWRPSLRPL